MGIIKGAVAGQKVGLQRWIGADERDRIPRVPYDVESIDIN